MEVAQHGHKWSAIPTFVRKCEAIAWPIVAAFISMYVFYYGKKDLLVYETSPSAEVVSQISTDMVRDFINDPHKYFISQQTIDRQYSKILSSSNDSFFNLDALMVRLIGVTPKEKERSISEDFLKHYVQCLDDFRHWSSSEAQMYQAAAFLTAQGGGTPANRNGALFKQVAEQGASRVTKPCLPYVTSLTKFANHIDAEQHVLAPFQALEGKTEVGSEMKSGVQKLFQQIEDYRKALSRERKRIAIMWLPNGYTFLQSISEAAEKLEGWRQRCIGGERSPDEAQYCLTNRAELGELLNHNKDVSEKVLRAIEEHSRHTQTLGDIFQSFVLMVCIVFIPFRPRLSVVDLFTGAAKASSGSVTGGT